MVDYTQLVDLLKKRLEESCYTEFNQLTLKDSYPVIIIKTPRRLTVSYICAITQVPDNILDIQGANRFFAEIRKNLTLKYARFPWWKELGTFFVLICNHELFDKLKGLQRHFKHSTGWHINVVAGTCLIDEKTFESVADVVPCGLFGKHYGEIRAAVSQWCEQQRNQKNNI